MISRRSVCAAVFVSVLAMPIPAFAAENDAVQLVPDWLSIAAGAIGLAIAVLLMVDAVLLRRVADGSIVADNIAYMMSAVVCFAASVLARWVAIFVEGESIVAQMGWAADLLVTAGMALLAVYFMRIRLAMQRFIQSAAAAYPGAEDVSPSDTSERVDDASDGRDD